MKMKGIIFQPASVPDVSICMCLLKQSKQKVGLTPEM